ncbi:MAG TPA: DUF192 domain-containing protein [Nitrososphaeraceae archaeon]|nr:DUF192 domain-containing protein [Nitrososphaeraceae archaeon]
MGNINLSRFFVVILLGFFGYFIIDDVVLGNQKEDFIVFAYSNNSLKEYLGNINVNNSEFSKGYIITDNYKVLVDIAITDKQLQDGLAIKNSLKENEGMLFFLGEPRKASFWMKDMKFPIDIIWLNESFSIVHIEQELQPCESIFSCKSFKPNSDALYVFETIAGFANKHDLKIGDMLNFRLIK